MRWKIVAAMMLPVVAAGCRSSKETTLREEAEVVAAETGMSRKELRRDEVRLGLTDAYIELDSVEIEGCEGAVVRARRARIVRKERRTEVRRERAEEADSVWGVSVSREGRKEELKAESGGRSRWVSVMAGAAVLMLIGIFFLPLWRK